MARQKIGEYKAKKIVFETLGLPYHGLFFDSPTNDFSLLEKLDDSKTYVVKVDQGVKKRFKQGLIKLNVSVAEIPKAIEELKSKGYTQFLIEEYQEHEGKNERYFSIQREREGLIAYVAQQGGVDIEEHQDQVQRIPFTVNDYERIARILGIDSSLLKKMHTLCDTYHFSFFEINPLVVTDDRLLFLDLAVEVDSAGAFFVQEAWTDGDIVSERGEKTPEEKAVEELSRKSQASFRLVVLNPNGSLWMLLSGGGASIVVADEVYNKGQGKELANYGEYSGNPNAEETYLYTKNILSLLLKSKAKKKVLIIAGGVANFTDIRITFHGIIKALEEVKKELNSEGVKVYVRRGGPYQEEGLSLMMDYLVKENLLGGVWGPEMVLTEVVDHALKEIQ